MCAMCAKGFLNACFTIFSADLHRTDNNPKFSSMNQKRKKLKTIHGFVYSGNISNFAF